MARRTAEANQLNYILKKIKQANTPNTLGKLELNKARKISNTIHAINESNEKLKKELLLLAPLIEKHKGAKVDVVKAILPNTVININGGVKRVTSNMRGCCLVLQGGKVTEKSDKE